MDCIHLYAVHEFHIEHTSTEYKDAQCPTHAEFKSEWDYAFSVMLQLFYSLSG